MVEFTSPVLSEEERERRREALRQKARAMIQSRPSSVLKDKQELQKLQEEMERALAEEEEEEEENEEPKPKKPEPLQIQVKLPGGESVDIKVAPDDTVPDIKEILEDDHDFPIEEQELFNNGKALADMYSDLTDCGIQAGDVLELNPPPIEIFVQAQDGKKMSMKVMPHITIDQLKQQIQEEHGIQADQLKLEFKGKSLHDLSASLTVDCEVLPGDVIDLKPEDITVHIQLYTGQKLPVTLPPTTSVGDLKKQVQAAHGISADEQELEFDGKPLDNDLASFVDCGIQKEAIINMKPPDIKISVVKHDGKKWSFAVKPTFSVGELKQMIQEKHEVPVEKQELEFEGKELDNDAATLEKDYGIKAQSKIDLKPLDMTVFVATHDGNKMAVTVKPTYSVGQLTQILKDEHDIPIEKHFLEFKGKTLEDPEAILEKDCKVKPEKVIDLKFKDITVVARDHGGETISVEVSPLGNIFDLQMKLQMGTLLALEDHFMMLEGKALPEDGTISLLDCGIVDGSVIVLDPRPVAIRIENVDGTTVEMTISPKESVDAVLEKLVHEHGIPVKEKNQTLYHGDDPLDDPNAALEACGVKGGELLFLDEPDIIFDVIVMPGSNASSVHMKPSEALYYLKKQIQEEHDIPFRSQGLAIEGKDDLSATNPELSLEECGIEDGDVVVAESVPDIVMEIRINDTDGKKKKELMSIKVKHFYTVESLQLQLHEDFKIPKEEQVLKYEEKELDDPFQTFKALGIGGGSIIDLHPWHIHVKTEKNELLAVVLSSDATVGDLQQRLAIDHEIPIKRQGLSYKGETIDVDPEAPLDSTGVKFGVIVDLKKLKKDKKVDDAVKSPKPKKRDSVLKSPKSKKRDSKLKSPKKPPKSKKRESTSKSSKKDKAAK
ncbi:unnamed protein product [Cylindrotheca closterium]|uniref:Ubiquitin-like domain-containing protein n=1 Tax=Cylindrotheca closterium TaxID=2856 RepID=A0AAD2CKP2_9STRA|nr:unnamed protein product [Cylindrotheca closterium]